MTKTYSLRLATKTSVLSTACRLSELDALDQAIVDAASDASDLGIILDSINDSDATDEARAMSYFNAHLIVGERRCYEVWLDSMFVLDRVG